MLTTQIIGSRIADARKKINISQASLAEQLFISPQAVGKWERGESMPDIITLVRLSEILGVDLNYFSDNRFPVSAETIANQASEEQLNETLPGKKPKKPLWNMSMGNWADADFSGLKNLQEKFSASNLKNCKFVGSDLSGLILKANNVNGCDFTGSNISSSHIKTTHLENNIFKDCFLQETEFSLSSILGSDFTSADLSGVTIKLGSFKKNSMEMAIMNRVTFNATHISDTIFSGSMEDCSFVNCDFTRVSFQNVTIRNTFFKCGNLKKLKFINCQTDRMTYEFLKNGKADLSGIILIAS